MQCSQNTPYKRACRSSEGSEGEGGDSSLRYRVKTGKDSYSPALELGEHQSLMDEKGDVAISVNQSD